VAQFCGLEEALGRGIGSVLLAPGGGVDVQGHMPTSEEYRRKAEECRRLAELAADESERASYTKMAVEWDQLAGRMADIETRREQ
jgi:hypothetical protein